MSLEGKTAPDSVIRGKLHKLIIDKTLTMAGAAADAAATGARIDEFQDEVDELKKQASMPYDAVKRSGDTMYGDLAFEFDGVVYKNYDEHNKPTPEAIGAVKKTGDTMTGALGVNGGYGVFKGGANSAQLEHYPTPGDTANSLILGLRAKNDLSTMARLYRKVDGVETAYNLYHTGNNPTAADVKALPIYTTYYNAADNMSADDVPVPFALMAISSTLNPELYAALNDTFAYVVTMYYSAAQTSTKLQIAFTYKRATSRMAFRTCKDGTWTAWRVPADSTDLAKYLPLTGGTLTGNLVVNSGQDYIAQVIPWSDGVHVRSSGADGVNGDIVVSESGIVFTSYAADGSVLANGLIYGEHNKPTPADIGAATDKPFEVTETTIAEDVDTYTISDLNCQEAILDFQVSGGGEDELSLNLYINGSFMHGTFYLTHWNHVIAKMQIRGKKLFLNTRVQKSDTDEFFDYVFPLSLTNEVNSITSIQLDCTGNDYYIPADSTITLYKMST